LSRGEGKQVRAGFWRRLAVARVDCFVIYAIVTVLVTVAAVVRLRIAFEPAFLASGNARPPESPRETAALHRSAMRLYRSFWTAAKQCIIWVWLARLVCSGRELAH
jgi:hypothetical protein